jgi:hypothetical protein
MKLNASIRTKPLLGATLNAAYNGVVNPLLVQNPEAIELMPTASSLKSAFSRAQLSLLPVLPENALDIHIPFEYSTILVDNNAERVNFLMFNYSLYVLSFDW